MPSKPRKFSKTFAEFEKIYGLSRSTIKRYVRDGVNLDNSEEVYARISSAPVPSSGKKTSDDELYFKSRALHKSEQAQIAKLERLKLEGKLAPIESVRAEASALAIFLSTSWIEFARQASLQFSERSVAEIEAIAMPWVTEKLEELKSRLETIGLSAAANVAREAKESK